MSLIDAILGRSRKVKVGDSVRVVGHDAARYPDPGIVTFAESRLVHVKFPQPLLRGWFWREEVQATPASTAPHPRR